MGIKYVDCHTHPIKCYYENNLEVISKSRNKGVAVMLVTGCDPKENLEVLEICKKFDYTFPVIGVHPNVSTGKKDAEIIESQITNDVVAIGEIGLDYYYPETNKEVQMESFISQIKVAEKYNLSVVIHMRDSYEDLYETLRKFPNVRFMIHTFSGNLFWAQKFYEIGCFFSFSAISTYKNSKELIDVIEWLPVDRILTETDAPYLPPASKRGEKNYPNYVIHTANFIAGIKKMPIEKFADQVLKNAKELFKLNVSRKH
ncbi:TatD family hydrolase [Mycoplasma sp. 1331]|uniref:TatD family hydrolase n=1 Tax=Mycoplasma tauri TaxID=547987 RepID=A0A953NDG0_9MOLU|nr:TatD family hydrolase [Mycoplasma tauri]MBZ4195469.1 TatD family hydrolase [Mycoplasma tauri]